MLTNTNLRSLPDNKLPEVIHESGSGHLLAYGR